MVPLWFIEKAYGKQSTGQNFRLVRVGLSGLPLAEHYRLGQTRIFDLAGEHGDDVTPTVWQREDAGVVLDVQKFACFIRSQHRTGGESHAILYRPVCDSRYLGW